MTVRVYGRVQGVFFRAFTRRTARALGLVGTVQNLDDGSVEIIAEGEEATLREFLESVRRGSYFSHIDSIKEVWGEPKGSYSGFRIR
ncbi:MAG TPA: acylphosphatase [Candidatus Paceibacterota bacterium]